MGLSECKIQRYNSENVLDITVEWYFNFFNSAIIKK